MKTFQFVILIIIIILLIAVFWYYNREQSLDLNLNNTNMETNNETLIPLPEPEKQGKISLEQAIEQRRSTRDYQDKPLSLEEIGQLLWSAQGVTNVEGKRAAPSAGATYPLEAYLVINKPGDLSQGLYRYIPEKHALTELFKKDISQELRQTALGQEWVEKAPAVIFFSGIFERTTQRYGERGVYYVYMEAGHAAQNVYLQAEALGLGTVVIGAFYDEQLKELLRLQKQETPLYLMPVGHIQ